MAHLLVRLYDVLSLWAYSRGNPSLGSIAASLSEAIRHADDDEEHDEERPAVVFVSRGGANDPATYADLFGLDARDRWEAIVEALRAACDARGDPPAVRRRGRRRVPRRARELPRRGAGAREGGRVMRVRRDLARLVALTVWQPWATLLACGVKLVENRSWSPGGDLRPGETFLVHAGRYGVRHNEVEDSAREWEAARELLVAHCHRGGACPTSVKRLFRRRPDGVIAGAVEVSYGALVALVTLDAVTRSARRVEGAPDLWWCGPVGWYVRDAVRFPPLPCAGESGLWVVAPDVERVVRERLCAMEECDA